MQHPFDFDPWARNNMPKYKTNKFYRKPSAETKNARKEEYAKKYPNEIAKLDEIIKNLANSKGKYRSGFVFDMYSILKTGSRPFTEKMHESVIRIINDPQYDIAKMIEMKEKLKPVMERVAMVEDMVHKVVDGKSDHYIRNYSALPFVESVKNQVETRHRITEKQMLSLAKVYKKYKLRYDKVEEKKK